MKVKQGESVIWLFLKINLLTTISMKRPRRELSIDMVVHGGILKKNITFFPCFTFIPKTLRIRENKKLAQEASALIVIAGAINFSSRR